MNGFDSMQALSILFLSLLFGYKSMLNCELQRILKNNVYINHIITFFCFLLLFSIFDANEELYTILGKSIATYLLFMLFIKNEINTVIITFILLVIDQSIRIYINNTLKKNPQKDVRTLNMYRIWLFYSIITTICIGFIFYFIKQKKEHADFSFSKLVFGTSTCTGII